MIAKLLLMISIIYILFGYALNMNALKANHGVMPVMDINANMTELTDIINIHYDNYYCSIGDLFIFSGTSLLIFMLLFTTIKFKKGLFHQ